MLEKSGEKDNLDYLRMGKRIKKIRTEKGMTQETLAELSGLSPAHISNIETAHTKASLAAVVAIANAMNASLDEILCDSLESAVGIYSSNVSSAFADCSAREARIINDTVDALKKSLIKSRK